MLRIRNLKKLVFFKPDRGTRYEHINGFFSEAVNWELIETHLPDMPWIALSIKAGKITPSTILRRLGRVVRTEFLLKYIGDVELRKPIQAATNNPGRPSITSANTIANDPRPREMVCPKVIFVPNMPAPKG